MRFFLKLVFIMNHTHTKIPLVKEKCKAAVHYRPSEGSASIWEVGLQSLTEEQLSSACPLELHDLDKLDNGFVCQSSYFNNNNNNKTSKSTCLVRMWWCTRTLLIIQCLTHTCSMNSSYCGYCCWANFLAPILQNPVLYSWQSVGEMP